MSNLTNEQIQEILDGAPEKNYLSLEPTHYDAHNGDYFILWVGTESGAHSEVWDGNEWVEDEGSKPVFPVPLYSYREILTLRQEVERLKAQQSEVAARAVAELKREVHRAIGNMEYAAFNLCESMNLDSKNGGRTVETTCPEKSLLIAIRDLKEVTGAR